MLGRNEGDAAIRDAVLLTAAGDDPGPGGNLLFGNTIGGASIWDNHHTLR
ncbi:DUF1403 family protein [Agrobacterium vitis]|nr:DUF1403 family protein [Agrobacterium vitis]